jgi:HEAT repeat protein
MTHTTGDHDLDRQLGGEPSEVAALLDSDDVDTQGRALGELTSRGKRAIPALLDALKSTRPRTRALAAEGLSSIADPSTADALAHTLNDKDGDVRAQAARGLAVMDDPRALDALVETLNDAPDLLHAEYTLSAYSLANYGPRALPAIAPLLKSPDQMTRMRANLVIKRILDGMKSGNADVQSFLTSYDPEGDKAERDKAADSVIAWVEKNHPENATHTGTGNEKDSGSKIDLSNF